MINRNNIEEFLLSIVPNGKKSSGGHIRGGCPICGAEDKFYINFEKALDKNESGKFVGSYKCFKGDCSGSIYTLLKHTGHLSMLSLKRTISDLKSSFKVINIESSTQDESCEIMSQEVDIPFNFNMLNSHSFLKDRGWTSTDFKKYSVFQSTDKYRDYVFISIKQRGKTVAYLGRSLKSAEYIKDYNQKVKESGLGFPIQKFRNSWGVDFAKILGGLDDIVKETHTLIVVEGIFDKVAVDNKLDLNNSKGFKCVFTFGKSFKRDQVNLIKKFTNVKNIIMFYDGDAISSSKATAKNICNEFESVKIAMLESGDPDDASVSEVKEALRLAKNQEELFTIVSL